MNQKHPFYVHIFLESFLLFINNPNYNFFKVLIDNGFTPEWIMLQKEIRLEKQNLKRSLYKARTHFGEYPFDVTEEYKWSCVLKKHQLDVDAINKAITKYNLVVPALQTQSLQISLKKIADKILKYGHTKNDIAILQHKPIDPLGQRQNIFSFLESFMIKNRRY